MRGDSGRGRETEDGEHAAQVRVMLTIPTNATRARNAEYTAKMLKMKGMTRLCSSCLRFCLAALSASAFAGMIGPTVA
jgi:hypothetical protein